MTDFSFFNNSAPQFSRTPQKESPAKLNLSVPPTSMSLCGLSPSSATHKMSPTSRFMSHSLPEKVITIHASNTTELQRFVNEVQTSLIIDVRPFNVYSQSHMRTSHNVCIPSTLLKRSSYDLAHVMNSSSLPDSAKNAVSQSPADIHVLLYDSESTDGKVSQQLYQTILKFCMSDIGSVSFIDGGFQALDESLIEKPYMSPARSPTSADEGGSSDNVSCESQGSSGSRKSLPFLSGFSLPTATAPDHRFLESLKKSVPKIDTSDSYHYNFKFPPKFEEKKDRLPEWLSFFGDVHDKEDRNKLIVQQMSEKFNKLERSEQVRLSMAISTSDDDKSKHDGHCQKHHGSNCSTPSALCPCCDSIDYNVPKGVELGYKNRYNNIWPYEHSRVPLVSSPSCPHQGDGVDDYFNANYISFDKLSKGKYIATQNPLDATKDDFWSTVWYNGVKAIICLVNSQVSNTKPYYENDSFMERSGIFTKIQDVQEHDGFVLREIILTKNGQTHTVFHFAYEEWPDFGTPDDFNNVFTMIKEKNKMVKTLAGQSTHTSKIPQAWELLVHCSAGCGRTGCFITMDMIMDSFLGKSKKSAYDPWGDQDLVYKSIQFQRQQRISMVQNLDQLIFCYESILNYVVTQLLK